MTYNQGGYFNRQAPFNRSSIDVPIASFSGAAVIEFGTQVVKWRSSVVWGTSGAALEFNTAQPTAGFPILTAIAPLGEAATGIEYVPRARLLGAYIVFAETSAAINYNLTAVLLRVGEQDLIVLADEEGAFFKTGTLLIVNSQSMEITLNGKPLVWAWKTGSRFFDLEHGQNTITFGSDSPNWTLTVTVTYEERWL